MKKINNILVGVDGSENSLIAAEIAGELGKKWGAMVLGGRERHVHRKRLAQVSQQSKIPVLIVP
jgi:nucleotide-binding universal stress UspA family protein